MIRTLALALVMALAATPAGAANIPSWCCPNTCQAAGVSFRIAYPRERGEEVQVIQNGQSIPLSGSFYLGEAADSQVHICIGFDAFGNREVKCLLTPPMM